MGDPSTQSETRSSVVPPIWESDLFWKTHLLVTGAVLAAFAISNELRFRFAVSFAVFVMVRREGSLQLGIARGFDTVITQVVAEQEPLDEFTLRLGHVRIPVNVTARIGAT